MTLYRIGQVNIHAATKKDVLSELSAWMSDSNTHGKYIVTPYSEFIVEAERNARFREVLNNADLSLADGSGIIWSGHFLYRTKQTRYACVRSLLQLVVRPLSGIYTPFPEKVSGSDVIFDIFSICHTNALRVFFVGGSEQTKEGLKEYIQTNYTNIQYTGHYIGEVDERHMQDIHKDIQTAQPHILITALSPPYQETWLAHHISSFSSVRMGFPLGGTLDYVAGTKQRAPYGWQKRGLEWLWRLIKEPHRIARMYRATYQFIRYIWGQRTVFR